MLMFIIALSASTVASSSSNGQSVSPADAMKRAIACSPANSNVTVRYDSDLQDDVIEIATHSPFAIEQYECVANTSYKSGYQVEFSPPFRDQYRRIFNDTQKIRNSLEARERLRILGLLDRVPHFDGNNLPAVAEKLEVMCGIKPRSVLLVFDENVSLQSERLTGPKADSEFTCLVDGLSAAGVQMGFVGNEIAPTTAAQAPSSKQK